MEKVTARQVSGQPQANAVVVDAGPLADPRFRYVIVDNGHVIGGFRREKNADAYRLHLDIVRRKL